MPWTSCNIIRKQIFTSAQMPAMNPILELLKKSSSFIGCKFTFHLPIPIILLMPRCMIQWRGVHDQLWKSKRRMMTHMDPPWTGSGPESWHKIQLTWKGTANWCGFLWGHDKEVKMLSLHLMPHNLHVNGRWGWWQLGTKTHYSHSRVCQTLLSLLPVIPNSKWWKMKLHIYEFISLSKEPTDSAVSVGLWWISLNSIVGVGEEICTSLPPHQKHLISSCRWYYGNVSSFKSVARSQERMMFVRYCSHY